MTEGDDARLRRLAAEFEKTAIAAEDSTRAARRESRKEEFVREIKGLLSSVRRSLARYNRKLAELVTAEASELREDVATIEEIIAREDQITELALAVRVLERKLEQAQMHLAQKRGEA